MFVFLRLIGMVMIALNLLVQSTSRPISKRPRLSATENPASNQPSTSSSSAAQGCGQSSAEKNPSDSEEHSDSDDSLTKRKQGKSAKRKSNKHNGRKRKKVGQQSDSNDESEAESSSDHSNSDESLPENEEFPVVLNPESSQAAGKYPKDKTKPLPKATFFCFFFNVFSI